MARVILVVLAVGLGSVADARPASPTAATAVAFKAGLSKKAYQRLNAGSWAKGKRSVTQDGITQVQTRTAAYSESHWAHPDHTTTLFTVGDAQGTLSGSMKRTLGGKLMRMTTLEASDTRQRLEVTERKGLFTIAQTFTADHGPGRYGTQTGSRWLKIGRVRVPLGAPSEKAFRAASKTFRSREGHAYEVDVRLGEKTAAIDSQDIALGRAHTSGRVTLDAFGASVGASVYTSWEARDIARTGDANAHFRARFLEALEHTAKAGGRIKFDLTDVDTTTRLPKGARPTYGAITTWELQQLRNYTRYGRLVDFYRQDDSGSYYKLSAKETARVLSVLARD